jgi:ubiquitin C-terminal hydrolase
LQSLGQFFKKETLSGSNKYHCEKCKSKQIATKGYVIEKSPDTILLHIKRFDNHGRKLAKNIEFSEKLSMRKVSRDGSVYELYSVVVHSGGSLSGGHYYNYSKVKNTWYCVMHHINFLKTKHIFKY